MYICVNVYFISMFMCQCKSVCFSVCVSVFVSVCACLRLFVFLSVFSVCDCVSVVVCHFVF